MVNNEVLRQRYLGEMGIQTYFPRFRLPGAGASPVYRGTRGLSGTSQQDVSQQEAVRDAAEHRATSPAAAPETLHQLLDDTASAPSRSNAAHLKTSQAAPVDSVPARDIGQQASTSKPGRESAPFAFVWGSLDSRLAVLAQMPEGQRGKPGPGAMQLLRNILGAVHADYRAMPLQEYPFAWPLDPRDTVADAEAARQAVQGFVARRLREHAASFLLVMADEMPGFLFSEAIDADGRDQPLAPHPQWPMRLLRIPSLHAMERDPSLKKPAWQRLQKLIAALDGNATDNQARRAGGER